MKSVTLYKVETEEVLVDDFEHSLQYRMMSSLDNFRVLDDSVIFSGPATFASCPIHQWRKIDFGEEKGGFLALDPVLRHLLESPFREESDRSITEAWHETNKAYQLADGYALRISVYNSLPWYKRIFRKV